MIARMGPKTGCKFFIHGDMPTEQDIERILTTQPDAIYKRLNRGYMRSVDIAGFMAVVPMRVHITAVTLHKIDGQMWMRMGISWPKVKSTTTVYPRNGEVVTVHASRETTGDGEQVHRSYGDQENDPEEEGGEAIEEFLGGTSRPYP